MDKNEQIEEMYLEFEKWDDDVDTSVSLAEWMYNAGYRKASDIAKEIYEKLVEKATLNYYCGYITVALEDVANVIREYVEEEK